MNKKILFIVITSFEVIFIIYILYLGKFIIVEPINESQVVFTNETNIKYFYEPTPNIRYVQSSPFKKNTIIVSTINNDTLFERYNYSIEKPKDVYRIISLGDSYTRGLFVNISDNYSELLEDMLNNYSKNCSSYKKFEVINLGMSGYDIMYSAARFEKRGLKYKSDVVVWFLKADDFTSNPKFWRKIDNKYFSLLASFDAKYVHQKSVVKYIIEPLSRVFNVTKKENIKLIVFTSHPLVSGDYGKILEEAISNYTHIEYVKLEPDVDYYHQNLTIYYDEENPDLSDRHPNEKGHKYIASKLYDYITSNVLKEC